MPCIAWSTVAWTGAERSTALQLSAGESWPATRRMVFSTAWAVVDNTAASGMAVSRSRSTVEKLRQPDMCPQCQSVKSRVRTRGHDADGRYLRYRECDDCGTYYSTVEALIPEPGSLYVLDAHRKYQNRMAMRRRRGYHGPGLGGPPLKPEPRLKVDVRVVAA